MDNVNRRSFLMSSAALPAAIGANARPSANNTVRVAVVGFRGQGKTHIRSYLNVPNVEIAALCDIDEAVLENGNILLTRSIHQSRDRQGALAKFSYWLASGSRHCACVYV